MRKNTFLYSCFALVLILWLSACHKEKEDYRDLYVGTYYCTGEASGKQVTDTLTVKKWEYNDNQVKIIGKYINTRVCIDNYLNGYDHRHFELLDQTEDRLRNYQGWFTDSTIHVYIYDRPELVGPEHVSETILDGVKAK